MNPSEPVINSPAVNPDPAASVESAAKAVDRPAEETPVSAAEVLTAPPVSKIVGYCRDCGQPLYEGSAVHEALGAIYCATHRPGHLIGESSIGQGAGQIPPTGAGPWTAPAGAANFAVPPAYTASPYTPNAPAGQPWSSSSSPHAGASPGLAFLLGLIPGVGAVYNGQYAKGLIHVIIFALLIIGSTERSLEFGPLFGLLITCFYFYMAFEAFHTAKLRQAGMPVDEFSGVIQRRGPSRVPVGPIVLIAIGCLFLLSNLDIIEFRRLMRFWPALLIVLGFYLLYERLAGSRTNAAENKRDGQ